MLFRSAGALQISHHKCQEQDSSSDHRCHRKHHRSRTTSDDPTTLSQAPPPPKAPKTSPLFLQPSPCGGDTAAGPLPHHPVMTLQPHLPPHHPAPPTAAGSTAAPLADGTHAADTTTGGVTGTGMISGMILYFSRRWRVLHHSQGAYMDHIHRGKYVWVFLQTLAT